MKEWLRSPGTERFFKLLSKREQELTEVLVSAGTIITDGADVAAVTMARTAEFTARINELRRVKQVVETMKFGLYGGNNV